MTNLIEWAVLALLVAICILQIPASTSPKPGFDVSASAIAALPQTLAH